uniref:Uncharacterized protein n=1 Tax=Mimivirus LCMiAC02 TaxID=2506609 RepID=A0A481Z116_9VIRU|nr:MAG: hypothetical protein LCMiAC02_02870 [Mimivirus LCMiAC02]
MDRYDDKKLLSEAEEDAYEDEYFINDLEIDEIKNDDYNVYIMMVRWDAKSFVRYVTKEKTKEKAQKILKHIYSEINECQEFVVTGMTSAYKEKGHYPNPLPKIEGLLDEEICSKIDDDYHCCVAIIINKGKLVDYIKITPQF